MTLRMVSLFAGIGGLALGLEASLGVEVVAQVECEEHCRSVLARQWPDAIQVSDVRGAIPRGLRCDVLCGGFPCQPHSVAGARKGLNDERHLWPEMLRWIVALGPRLVVVENVPGLLTSSGGEVFSQVLSDLHAAGFDARWRTMAAAEVGAPHRRRRIFLLATRRGTKPLRLPPASSMRAAWGHTGWPARPGEPQHPHEPPRVAADVPQRRHRLKALGNAVVPHCAYAAGMWARESTTAEGRVVVQFVGRRRLSRDPGLFDQAEAPMPKWPRHGVMVAGAVRVCAAPRAPVAGELWPTATASDAKGSRRSTARTAAWTSHPGTTLGDAVQKDWPTPTTNTHNVGEDPAAFDERRERLKATGTNGNGAGEPLAVAVQRDWPTPRATESEMRTYAPCPTHGTTHGKCLQAEAIALDGDPPAPAAGARRADIGALNPAWVELLMGFPPGWTVATVAPRASAQEE